MDQDGKEDLSFCNSIYTKSELWNRQQQHRPGAALEQMTGRSLWGRGACCFNYCTNLQLQSSVRTDPTRHFQSVYFIVVGYAFFKFTLTKPLRKIHTRGGKMVQ